MTRRTIVDHFLNTQTIALRSRYSYAGVLRAFDGFVYARSPDCWRPSMWVFQEWLKQDAAHSPLANVAQRALVICRYLDWRVSTTGGSHLLSDLKEQFGQRLLPIVVALLQDEYEQALARLRPLHKWGSVRGIEMQEHISRMRSLGYRYDVAERDLLRFDRFLQQHAELAPDSLAAQLEAWRHESSGPRHQWRVQQCGQLLCKAARRKDLSLPLLPRAHGLYSRMIQQERRPTIFSKAQISQILRAARSFPSETAPLRPIVLYSMLALTYCAGLRLGEVAALKLGDLNLELGTLEIRETKFFKSRRLPLARGVIEMMRCYLQARAATNAPLTNDAPMWWSSLRRKGYSYGTIEQLLIKVMQRAGLKPTGGHKGPRVHDLRHTFVAHRMMQWYQEGVEPQSLMPLLATYLGHKNIQSTLAYLNIEPELLHQANERYRRKGVSALQALETRR